MSNKINTSNSTEKISDLYNKIKSGNLILQPEWQRKFVWNDRHKENFIDTILRGLPFPEIYRAQQGIDLEMIKATDVVVDGQQRLSTIRDYIDGKLIRFKSSDVKSFKELSNQEQKDFLNYKIAIRDLGDIEPEDIKDIFKRINSTKYNLNSVEINNAIYDGEFIATAKLITNKSKIKKLQVFSSSQIDRMADFAFTLLVLSTIENDGYFSGESEVEKFIILYNNEYPNSEKRTLSFLNTAKAISNLKLKDDSIWLRKSNFFTLFIELMKKKNINVLKLKKKLVDFENNIISSKEKDSSLNEFAKYYASMYTGTNSRQARINRSDLFKKYVLDETQLISS